MSINNNITVEPTKANVNSANIKADLYQYSGNWIWRAVECLVESPDFNASPKWVAQRLNITVEKAVDAFEGLERLGYIKRDGATYKTQNAEYHIGTAEFTRDELLSIQSKLAPQIISKLKPTSKFTTYFMLGNDELIAKYTPQIMKIYGQMHKEGLEKGLTEVVASEISFAIVSEGNAKGNQ